MPCLFPGMDPFSEMQPFWSDFAPTLLAEIRNALLPQLLSRYDVRIEEYPDRLAVAVAVAHDFRPPVARGPGSPARFAGRFSSRL
jgi:hypothetical protein